LPNEIKEYVAKRMGEVLTGTDKSRDFAHLTPGDW
jgi:hypothetical protein